MLLKRIVPLIPPQLSSLIPQLGALSTLDTSHTPQMKQATKPLNLSSSPPTLTSPLTS